VRRNAQHDRSYKGAGRFSLSHRDGVVSNENERDGYSEVRAIAKGARLRNSSGATCGSSSQAEPFGAPLALAATSRRLSGAGNRKTSSRAFAGNNPVEASPPQQEKSADISLPRLRGAKDIRRAPVSPLLAYFRQKRACFKLKNEPFEFSLR
jgi:hypothetical protein